MKVINTKYIIFFTAIVALVLVSGCKSKQKSVDTDTYTKNWEAEKAIDDIRNKELSYANLTAKGAVELKVGESGKRISAHYKILKDSIMQVSLRVPLLGEVMRMDMTPEKVTVVDRLKGQYASESFSDSEFLKSVDLNYYNLQALLTNSLFLPGEKSVDKANYSRFKIATGGDMLRLQTLGKPDLIYNFAVDASEKIISLLVTKKSLENTLQFTYTDFVEHDNKQFYPSVMVASVNTNKKALSLAISYSGLDLDRKDFRIDISVPQKYQEITFKELLQTYMKGK